MQANNNLKEDKNKVTGIHQILVRYIVYWPLFLLFFFLSVGGAWLYLFYTTPLYQVNARILIKDEKKGAEDSKALESLNLLTTKKIIENEIEVIQSRTLINEVVGNLYLYSPVFEEGKVKPLSAYVTSPIKVEVNDLKKFKESEKIYFKLNQEDSQVVINNSSYPLNKWVSTPYGSLRFSQNNRYLSPAKGKLYFTLVDPKKVSTGIQQRLTVSSTNKLSTILNLEIKDEVPERGEDILNALLSAYSRAIVADKNSLASNTLTFVEDRLSNVKSDLNAIEQKVQRYKSKRGAMDISTQGRLFLESVSSNDQRLSEINTQIAVLNQAEKYVRSKDSKSGIVPSTFGITDAVLTQLLNNLYNAELQREKLKKTTAENYPSLLSLNDQIEKIKPSILENIQSNRNALEASKANLTATNSVYSSALQSIPQKEKELIEINREQSIKNEIYGFLLKKKEETALTHASTVADNRVIDMAQSSIRPVSPKKKVIYMAAFTLAFLVSIGSVVTRETFTGKILFRSEIENYTSFPVVGEIAHERSKEQIVMGEGKRTFIAEQFRQLRLSLSYSLKTKSKKRILVTSTIAGEGKSFVAANLALSFALAGKKVVLLELDLNRPSLRTKLNIVSDKGISDYLYGNREPEELIKGTDIHKNLFFISSGDLPNNPSELLMNGKIQELLNFLEGAFDYIVIDTAPSGPVTDAYILSPLCDLTLYIIRHKYTPKVFVQRLEENNKIKKLKNIAIVFNGILPRGFGKTNYGYGYGYGYSYNQAGYHTQKSK